MAFCRKCGAQIDDEAVICPTCGVAQKEPVSDEGGIGWGLLGCCIPILGLILYLVWKDSKPNTAEAVGKGALASVIIGIAYYLIMFIFGAALAFA